jgi:FkbM family methyltransferase
VFLRRIFKEWLHTLLVAVFKRLPPAARVKVIRDGIPMSDIYRHLPTHLLVDLSLGGASVLTRVKSIVVEGALGTYEAMARDRTILPSYVKTGTWSSELQTLLADRIFKNGAGTFLDIGANIGLTCIPVATRHRVSCIGFEPDPTNYALLRGNIARNSVSQYIQTHKIALSDSDGELALELSGDNLGDHRLRLVEQAPDNGAFGESHRQTIKVKALRLDEVVDGSQLQSPVLAKIDVQGAELHVLKGSTGILKKIDVIVIEYWPYGLKRAGASFIELSHYLRVFPYGAILGFDRTLNKPSDSRLDLREIDLILSELNGAFSSSDPDFHIDIVLCNDPGRELLEQTGSA